MHRPVTGLFAALFAISAFGATTAQLDAARERAIAWLINNQRPDGSWRGVDGLEVQTTAAALEAFVASRLTRLPAFSQGVSYLLNAEAGSTDALARQTSALAVAGSVATAQRLAQRLLIERNTGDNLWGAYRQYQGSYPDSPLALIALKARSTTVPAIDSTIAGIVAGKLTPAVGQTGWGYTAGNTTDGVGFLSSRAWLIPTAYVAIALKQYQREQPSIDGALAWLKSRQQPDGAFLDDDNSKSALLNAIVYDAIAATSPQGAGDAAAVRALDYLISPAAQSADGSFSQDPFQTALAVKALATTSVFVDTDQDGVPDSIERLVGTDPYIADSKGLAGGSSPVSWPVLTQRVLIGKPLVVSLPRTDVAVCCTVNSGTLPDGLAFAVAATTLRVTGTPSRVGSFSIDVSSQTAANLEQRLTMSIEVIPTLFRATTDPYPLSALSSDPVINKLKGGWQALIDDFNNDGRLDWMTYFNGADEWFVPLGCTTCTAYGGPAFGQLIGFQNVNGTLARVSTITSNARYAGDLRSVHSFDFNGDGKRDLLLVLHPAPTTSTNPADQPSAAYKNLVLLRNDTVANGALFLSDVTAAVGLTRSVDSEVVVLDANRDGSPDLVVSDGANPAKLFVFNRATGVFDDRSSTSNLGPLLRPVAIDFDGDGLLDIATANAVDGLRFLRNVGNGTFTQSTGDLSLSAFAGRRLNRLRAADISGDGRPDLVVFETATVPGAFAGSRISILQNNGVNPVSGKPTFVDVTPSNLSTPSNDPAEIDYGGEVADLDSDGRLDIVVASREPGAGTFATTVFRQNTNGSFSRLTDEAGFPRAVSSFDSPVAVDLDGDAELDLVLPNSSNTSYQLRNVGSPNNALIVVLRGRAGTEPLGARVTVTAGSYQLARQWTADHGRTSRLHFGLNSATTASIRVDWPDGNVQNIDVSGLNRIVTVVQP